MNITPEQLRAIRSEMWKRYGFMADWNTYNRIFTEYQKLQGEQEPVATAECKVVHGHMCQFLNRTQHGMDTLKDGDKLYAAPPDLSKRIAELEAHEKQLCAWVDENGTSKELVQEICKQRDELTAQNAQLRGALESIAGERQCCDNLMSNIDIAKAALALPNLSADWLRKHDAEVLRNAAGKLEYGVRQTMADQLCDMATELEGEIR